MLSNSQGLSKETIALCEAAMKEGHDAKAIGVFGDGSIYIRSYDENNNYIGEIHWKQKAKDDWLDASKACSIENGDSCESCQ